MFGFLLLLFSIVTITEIWLIVQVNSVMGGWETFGLLILDSAIGAWLVRREGLSILGKIQGELSQGKLPTDRFIDGALVLVAGALMLTPGFLTDGLGLLLLLPPTRAIVRNVLKQRFAGRVKVGGASFGQPFGGFGPGQTGQSGPRGRGDGVTDVHWTDVTDDDDDPSSDAIELGPSGE